MTRHPSSSDSFLPSGALDFEMPGLSAYGGNPPSILSMASSQNLNSYPDHLAFRAAPPHSLQSLPPFLPSSSPLPQTIPGPTTTRERLPDFTFPPAGPAASISGGFSAQGASAPQPSTHLVQRLLQQNGLIRDAWEAERNYLEANRRRAEEVYQEERAIMEDFREAWSAERLELLQAMQLLRERNQRLEGENSALKAMAAQSISQVTGVLSPLASQRGDSVEGSARHSPSGSPVPRDAAAAASVLPPGLDGASRRPHFASPPKQQPSPPLPIDPRTQPETSAMRDFLAAASDEAEAFVAVIDVQQIDPRLEGISLRATAIQKPTFSQEMAPTSTSPPPDSFQRDEEQQQQQQQEEDEDYPGHSQELQEVQEPEIEPDSMRGRTRRALAAAASRRLTMHAGHTPIHSVSVFPTMTTGTGASSVASRSGDTTPTRAAPSPPPYEYEHTYNTEEGQEGQEEGQEREREQGQEQEQDREREAAREEESAERPADARDNGDPEDDVPVGHQQGPFPMQKLVEAEPSFEPELGEAPLQPDNDPPLKGPLMVKNIPAQDELFWAAVNKKLEPISQGQDALPTVMQAPVASELGLNRLGPVVANHGDLNSSSNNDDDDLDLGLDLDLDERSESSGSKSLDEIDVPLRIRTTTNFGAPFGRM